MSYLMSQIFWCLLAAFVLGFVLGWLLRHFACKAALADLEKRLAERPSARIPGLPIEDIEGIGPGFGRRLREIGIKDTSTLLTTCTSDEGRRKVAAAADNLDDSTVRNWATMADLLRVPGVGGQWAELLWRSGVANVQDLGRREVASLMEKMKEINEHEHRVRELPGEHRVEHWIAEARHMKAVLPDNW